MLWLELRLNWIVGLMVLLFSVGVKDGIMRAGRVELPCGNDKKTVLVSRTNFVGKLDCEC